MFKYKKKKNYIIITGFEGKEKDIVIPETIENLPVKEIAKRAFQKQNFETVLISDTVEKVGEFVFNKCKRLKTVIMMCKINTVPFAAFSECVNLKNVLLSERTENIGEYSFYKCEKLSQINLDNIRKIGQYAFAGCNAISDTVFSRRLESLGNYAFADCKSLSFIDIPTTFYKMGKRVFAGCENLNTVYIPNTIKNYRQAFLDCGDKKHFHFEKGVKHKKEFSKENLHKLFKIDLVLFLIVICVIIIYITFV